MSKYKLGGIDLSSSVNPDDLAMTVKGIIIGLSSVIVFVASLKGITILPEQIASFAGNVATTVSAMGVVIGGIGTIYGVLRKILVAYSVVKE